MDYDDNVYFSRHLCNLKVSYNVQETYGRKMLNIIDEDRKHYKIL